MKTISIISMKGGVGKTISAVNISHILAAHFGQRVLLIDADKQGNTTNFFGLRGRAGMADVLEDGILIRGEHIHHTRYPLLQIMPGGMDLHHINREIMLMEGIDQHCILGDALSTEAGGYWDYRPLDYCIIDCAPDINIATINAMAMSDEVIVPVRVDQFALDGLADILDIIADMQSINPRLYVAGAFVSTYRANKYNAATLAMLREKSPVRIFDTVIRESVCVTKSTFSGRPLLEQSPRSNPAKDYVALVEEVFPGVKNVSTWTREKEKTHGA